jgi:tetratricopeptide (TPR) repeat protein
MQIGQRAATLKQLARVAIRRGEFHVADTSLVQALELYAELYGEHTLHINVAAVRFQQGALAFQCEQLDDAWTHFSECLQARRHVYEFSQGNHLEVSSVIHELGCVAFAQNRIAEAREMLAEEKAILDQLYDSTSNHQHRQRLLQGRLTNLTWLRKCAKESGDEAEARRLATERSELKRKEHHHPRQQAFSTADTSQGQLDPRVMSLQQEAMRCRRTARKFVLSKNDKEQKSQGKKLESALTSLKKELEQIPLEGDERDDMRRAANSFHQILSEALLLRINNDIDVSKRRSVILKACDDLRDVLREFGLQVNDTVRKRISHTRVMRG